jgi:PKHD-type hydroxylase
VYNKISNDPIKRSSILYSYCYWNNAFSDKEIDEMCNFFSQHEFERAKVVKDENKSTNENIRKSNVIFFNRNEVTFPIFDKLNMVIEQLNENFYNFILNGYESFQYTEYDSSEKGEYNFHMDTFFGEGEASFETRKLSLVMCLNRPGIDFEGGQFYINQGSEKEAHEVEMEKGRIILFPSFLIHRVAPVTKGKRKSLVIWVLGPKFR